MTENIFWGQKGEYGPFSKQEDGWPNAGEVVRHYRRKKKMSAKELARLYGEALGVLVTARWILKMEQQSQVPLDMTKRRILTALLDIPPLLLGLASLEAVTHVPRRSRGDSYVSTSASPLIPHETNTTPTTLASPSLDLEWYSKEIRLFWRLHYTHTAQDMLADLVAQMNVLAPLQRETKGSLKRSLSELLNSSARLAATLLRDTGNFKQAYVFANESVRLAKDMGSDPYALQIIAASQYTRGVVRLAWGAFGDGVKQGKVILEPERLKAALQDFQRALTHASPQLKGIIYSEMARATSLLATSPIDTTIAQTLMEQAERFVDKNGSDDFYTQILLNGDVKGLDNRRLILGRAKMFLALGRPEKVREELDELEELSTGPTHTRRTAWTDILSAQASFEVGDSMTAIEKATSAFHHCNEVHALAHLARINELSTKLLESSSRDHAKVKHLGKLVRTVFPTNSP